MMDPRLYFENIHPEARAPLHSEPSALQDTEITAALRAYQIPPDIARRCVARADRERVKRRKSSAIRTAKNPQAGPAKEPPRAEAKAAPANALWRLRGLSRE